MAVKIVIIEDDEDIADLIQTQAEQQGYKCIVNGNGYTAYDTIIKEQPNLVILDVMLPGRSGLDICRKLKSDPQLQHIPVIMLSAKAEELDVVLGLELGADDYVAKPYSKKELFSRIKAVLRRSDMPKADANILRFGDFQLDVDRYLLTKFGNRINITLTEFGLLRRLLQNRGKVLTRAQLLDDGQADDHFILDRNVDVHVASLRKKLGNDFEGIETVRGVGYRFKEKD